MRMDVDLNVNLRSRKFGVTFYRIIKRFSECFTSEKLLRYIIKLIQKCKIWYSRSFPVFAVSKLFLMFTEHNSTVSVYLNLIRYSQNLK